jgi:hypothetical protein
MVSVTKKGVKILLDCSFVAVTNEILALGTRNKYKYGAKAYTNI